MPPKKLFFLLSDLNGGGAEKVLITIANEIAKDQSFEVHFIVIANTGAYQSLLSPNLKTYFLYPRLIKFNKLRSIPKIVRLMRKIDPITSISTLNMANVLNILCSKLSLHRHKIIIREANTPSLYFQYGNLKKKILMYTMKLFSRFTDVCVCPSVGVKNDVESFYKIPLKKLSVLRNPVHFKELEKKSLEDVPTPEIYKRKVILTVGRLTYAKGYDILLRAMPKVLQSHDVNLVILGEGPEMENLIQQARDLKIEDHVFLLGFHNNPYPFYKNATLFVLSSHWEGSPNALIHSIALKTPSISSNCPSGPNELLEQKALYWPNTPENLSQKILQALNGDINIQSLQSHYRLENIVKLWKKTIISNSEKQP